MTPGRYDPVDDQERRCLLRAARAHMLKLLDDYSRLEALAKTSQGAQAAADSAAMELACLQRAVTWLWRMTP